MPVSVSINSEAPVVVPDEVHESLDGFRAWANSEGMENVKLCYYRGEVFVEMGGEQVFSHGSVKTEIGSILARLVKRYRLGYLWINGVLVTNEEAELSGNPDVVFVSFATFESGRMTLAAGQKGGYTELVGTPDIVMEVVNPGSVRKDNDVLREGYWEAGVPEYWLVDALGDKLLFRILKRWPKGYVEAKTIVAWIKSAVFGKAFRFTRTTNALGQPEYTLWIR